MIESIKEIVKDEIILKGEFVYTSFFTPVPDRFENFLRQDRANLFLMLHILKDNLDVPFIAGMFDYVRQYEEGEMRFGPRCFTPRLNGKSVFEYVLYVLSFGQVILHEPFVPTRTLVADAPEEDVEANDHFEDIFFVSENLILTQHGFWSREKVDISGVSNVLTQFIEKHKSDIQLEHGAYLQLLLQWFPGLIQIRSLSQSI